MSKVKQRLLVILCVILACLLMVFLFMDQRSTPAVPENPIDIIMSIHYPKTAKKDGIVSVQQVRFSVGRDTSVNEALQLYCKVEEIDCRIDSDEGTVVSINGIDNDDAAGRTWQFTLNGRATGKTSLETKLSDGDQVVWSYEKVK